MKFPFGRCLAFLLFFAPFLLPSCGTKRPNLSQGLKLTIVTNNKEAITDAAGNPDDSLFSRMLDSAFSRSATTTTCVSNFIQYYNSVHARKPLTDFFYSGNPAGFESEEALGSFLKTAIEIKRKRMDEVLLKRIKAFFALETNQVRIEHPADNQLIIYIPGITDKAALKPVFGNREGLHFWEIYSIEEVIPHLVKLNETLAQELAQKQPKQEIQEGESLQDMVDKGKLKETIGSPLFSVFMPALDADGRSYGGTMVGFSKAQDTATVNKLLSGVAATKIFPANVKWIWGYPPGKRDELKTMALYAIRVPPGGKSTISDEDIATARGDRLNGKPEISIEMTPVGAQKWSNMTRNNTGKGIAMELNHFIYSAPTVNEEIKGGRSSVTGDFTDKEIDELVKVLNSGSFPLSFKVTHTDAYQK